MIPVTPKPEYHGFDSEVRRPGLKFLRRKPRPSNKDFSRHNYWTRAVNNLKASYSGLCAYTSLYLVDTGSVDHFRPKTKYPYLAYEWDNYRLARQRINSRKGNSEEVVDPFRVQPGWFVLDFPSCLIRPGNKLNKKIKKYVNATINILRLNDDDSLVQERCDFLVDLAQGDITMDFLDRRYPFLAFEVKRQGVEKHLSQIFKIS